MAKKAQETAASKKAATKVTVAPESARALAYPVKPDTSNMDVIQEHEALEKYDKELEAYKAQELAAGRPVEDTEEEQDEQEPEEEPEAPEKPAPTSTMNPVEQTDETRDQQQGGGFDKLQFTPVETGDFEFWAPEAGDVFTGTYLGEVDENEHGFKGLWFRDYATGQKRVLNRNYQLEKLFVHQQSETHIDWNKSPIFQITYKGKEELSGGKTVSRFQFAHAYPQPAK